jgi:outer membrane receptor for ferrienterochelin and colicins
VAFAEVYFKGGGDHVFHVVTDENGNGTISLIPGAYLVDIYCIGFESIKNRSFTTESGRLALVMKDEDALLEDAVVTVQYEKRSARQAVEKIDVIDVKQLQSRSAYNLREALAYRMNVQIRQDNSTGSAMSLMGISGQNVKILVDGVPVIGRLDGNIDLAQINMADVERIEVIEGPVSTNYGTNALAGVINIITKKSSSKEGSYRVDSYSESTGQFNYGLQAAKSFGRSNIRFSGGRQFFRGWSPEDTSRWDLWKPKEQYFGRLQLSREYDKTSVNLKSEYFNELLINKGKPLTPYFESAFDERFRTIRADQKLQISHEITENRVVDGFVAYNFYARRRNTYFKDLVNLIEDPLSTDGSNDTTTFRALNSRATYSYSGKMRKLHYQMGYDFMWETAGGARIENDEQEIVDAALFGSAEYRASRRLVLKPGFRWAYNSAYQAPLVPMMAARYQWGRYALRASYSKGFRAPDIKELYIYFVDVNHNVQGNPNLEAEKSDNIMFSLSGMRPLKKSYLQPSISAFHNQISNKITLANMTSTLYTYQNIQNFSSSGARFNLKWLNEKSKVDLGWGLTSIDNGLAGGNGAYSYMEWTLNLSHEWKKIQFNVNGKYNGAQNIYLIDAESAELIERSTRAYTMLDAQLSKSWLKEQVNTSFGVRNILGVTNIQSTTSSGGAHGSDSVELPVGTGTSYYISLSYAFGKN